jgi:hypothetical protein
MLDLEDDVYRFMDSLILSSRRPIIFVKMTAENPTDI